MTIAALIVAAGRGARMGAARSKVFLSIAGETILARAVTPFLEHPRIGRVVVAVADEAEARSVLGAAAARVVLVRGGQQRQDSVWRAMQSAGPADVVLVHDAARPLIEPRTIDAVIEGALRHGAAVPVLPVTQTVKRLDREGRVIATLRRDDLALAQTPQGFRRELLERAYEQARRDGYRGTDDASLVERTGERVMAVEGSVRNIKVTHPPDLMIAEWLVRDASPDGRSGNA